MKKILELVATFLDLIKNFVKLVSQKRLTKRIKKL